MKLLNKILYGLMAVPFFALASCDNEEEYKPGEPDVDGCYGVYFPSQEIKTNYEPTEALEFTVTAARKVEKGAISVPLEISGNEKGYFELPSTIDFADGEAETSFTVKFPKAPVGEQLSLSLQITDPQYVSKYSSFDASVSASVIIEKWISLGKGKIRDDCFTTFYKTGNPEWEVEILENDSQKGFYRLVDPYGDNFPYSKQGTYDKSKTYYFEVHAEDPNGVYIPVQYIGRDWGEGMMMIGSIAGLKISQGATLDSQKSAGNTGTLEKGIITFPKNTLAFGEANYNNGGLYAANKDGMFRICLPGAVPVDYALSATFGYSSEGALPIAFKMGADIASVKYAIYQGKLADADIKTNVTAIAGNKEPNAKVVGETGVESVTLAKTDVYTLVAVGFDSKGEAQASVAGSFNYVAKEDSEKHAVVVNAGLELTSRFEGAGVTKINSISFYVYGSKLTDVKIGLYDKATVDKAGMDAVYKDVLAGASLKDEVLEKINNGGYSDVFTKLNPLTEYVMVVWATNGYLQKFVTASLSTDGLPFEKLGTATYTYCDLLEGASDKDLNFCVNPNYANTYVVENWCNGVNFTFTYDQTSGKVVVPLQATGMATQGHDIQIVEAKNFYSTKYEKYDQLGDSKYDAATKTFKFFVAYVIVEPDMKGSLGFGEETLVLSQDVVLPATPGKTANFFSVPMPKSVKELSGQFTKSKSLSVPMCLAGFAVERESKSVEFSATPVAKSEVSTERIQNAPVSVIR
mgnify:FL=1